MNVLRSAQRAVIVMSAVIFGVITAGFGAAQADPPTPPPKYVLANQQTGLCLTATDAANNFYVLQTPCTGSSAQRWQTEQIAPNGAYLMDQQYGRCLSATGDGSGYLVTRECDWYGYFHLPRGWDPLQRWWKGNGRPTTFYSSGSGGCMGVIPNNALIHRLDCGSGAAVLWYY